MISFKGRIRGGYRGATLDGMPLRNKQEALEHLDKGVLLSGTGRILIQDGKVVGRCGAHKMFLEDGEKGFLIFYSPYTGKRHSGSKRFTALARKLNDMGVFPDFKPVRVKLNMVCSWKKRSHRVNTECFALHVDRLHIPEYVIRDEKYLHKLWGDKRIKPIHLTEQEREDLNIAAPGLNYEEYLKFEDWCKKIYMKDSRFKKLKGRKSPSRKWSNVVFCMKRQKWYFTDFD